MLAQRHLQNIYKYQIQGEHWTGSKIRGSIRAKTSKSFFYFTTTFHQNKQFGLVVLYVILKELFNIEISKMDPVHPVWIVIKCEKVESFFSRSWCGTSPQNIFQFLCQNYFSFDLKSPKESSSLHIIRKSFLKTGTWFVLTKVGKLLSVYFAIPFES